MRDFVYENGSFLSKSDFEKKFNFEICFMQYNSMIIAVAKFAKGLRFCKETYSNIIGPFVPYHCVEILLYKKCTKHIYKLIYTNTVGILPTSIRRWNSTIVQRGYREIILQNLFKICFEVTKDSSIQWLQYIENNAYPFPYHSLC